MKQVPFRNDTDKTVYRGAVSIPPGQSRMVEAQFVTAVVEKLDEAEPDPVRELLALSVKDIQIAVSNPDAPLSQDFLESALEAEKAKKSPRVGAVKALGDAINTAIEASLELASKNADNDAAGDAATGDADSGDNDQDKT